ncbi:high affinity nitrate transporter [Chloropicon primus]|uniref:High affinity nitrate transporter n=1 Tax=Chloropicon primus TaxID=1764295 RepID=A0A5B8MG66_9CHLO|nr:high affinity nitrate transporter [Chloropicon primus]UPQ97863.1 high affinity nitrate transporter [Chloropicon primus]|eukprot:QDZ18655.1 high affinity nitrate transporter [Chloropicon primus]
MTMTSCFQSTTFKVVSLGCLGVAVMMAIALSLAFTLGAPTPKSTVAYTSIETTSLAVTSTAEPCKSDQIGACPTVLMYGQANDTLMFESTVEANSTEAKSVTFQVCYTDAYIGGRPWRKPADVIGSDKQCFSACKGVVLEGSTAKCTWTVGDMLGQAVYYFRALAADAEGTFVMGATNTGENFQVNVYNGRTTPIIVAVIVMSCVAWAILLGGLIMERVKKVE